MPHPQIWILSLFFALIGNTAFAEVQDKETVGSTLGWGAALSDIGRLHLEDIAQDKSGAWAIIHVTASPLSGHAMFSGSRIDPRTGDFLPGNSDLSEGLRLHLAMVKLANGMYFVSEGLTPDARSLVTSGEKEYNWESDAFYGNTQNLTIDPDSAFVGPHSQTIVAICRLNPDKTGADRFSSTCVIPNEWEPSVAPAVQFYRQHPGAFAESNTVKGNGGLADLLHNKNPFLAAAACRALAQVGYFSPASAFSLVKQSQGIQQALFAYLLLHYTPLASEGSIAAILGNIAETATTSEQLHPVVLAAYVRHQETFLLGGDCNLPVLFERIDRKASTLAPDPEQSGDASAKSIDILLKNAQVRKQANNTLSL